MQEVIWVIFLFALGSCVGSFLNVVIWRLPRGESIVLPGSHCPACGRAIRWHDNIPLLSWIVLRGRCRDCKAPISPRYLVVEAATAVLVAGLYAWFFLLPFRRGAGSFAESWPAYVAHASLFCGLLASSLVDIEDWIIPLEVCWFVSAVGMVCAAAAPPVAELLPRVSPVTGAMSLGAAAGLAVAMVLVHYGLIQRSFLDADDKPARPAPAGGRPAKAGELSAAGVESPAMAGPEVASAAPAPKARPASVGFTSEHGVNPRKEILREVVFLAPAGLLAIAAWALVTKVPAARGFWLGLTDVGGGGRLAPHLGGLTAALFGYLVGGLWIWSFRILGTLAFGREAMGLGDVHILAAVGAVCGWVVPSLAFFLAALLAVAWALTIFLLRRQRELPYGPWLAGGALVAVLFYDRLLVLLKPYTALMALLEDHYLGGGP